MGVDSMAGLLTRFRDPLFAQLIGDDRAYRLHDVEALLYRPSDSERPVGRLWESRWSNNMGSLTLDLAGLPADHDGTAQLYADGMLLAGFDFAGRRLAFSWIGRLSGESLSFEAGQTVRLEVGRLVVSGIVCSR